MSAPPPPQALRDYANQRLAELWQQTGDQSILDYINSDWTTPVSPKVQNDVSRIVGRPVPATGAQPAPAPPGLGTGLFQGATSSQQTALNAPGNNPNDLPVFPATGGPQPQPDVPPPGNGSIGQGQVWGAYSNSAAGLLGPKGGAPLPVQNKGGSFFDAPASRPPGPTGDYGSETTPASVGLGGPPAPVAAAAQRAGQRGGNAVSGFVPAATDPLTVTPGSKTTPPTGAFGAIDPTSAIGQQGYTQAQAGDPTALSAVLTSILGKFGIDVNRGGIFTPGLVSSLAPYLKTVMEYGGLANGGKPVIPSQLADQFGGMVGGANTFGQIQDFAKGLLPTLGGLLSAPAGALADSGNQAGVVNDILGMLTAGASPLYQQYQQGVNKKTLSDYVQSQLGGPTQNYIDWMRQNAAKTPGSDLLAQIIGASR